MIVNKEGDVKVLTEKGVPKWIPKHLAENKKLMATQKLTIAPAPPVALKPPTKISELKEVVKPENENKLVSGEEESLVPKRKVEFVLEAKEEVTVAKPEAKRGRPKK